MSAKELERVAVLARVVSGALQVWDAGVLLRVSYRQAKRLWRRCRQEGPSGMRCRAAWESAVPRPHLSRRGLSWRRALESQPTGGNS